MNKTVQPQWLEWAKELQFIAQGGLTYSKDVFDIERFERIREIAAEMLSLQSEILPSPKGGTETERSSFHSHLHGNGTKT